MATRRRATSKPPDNFDRATQFLEKFGLPTALLLGAGYFGFNMILKPLVQTYQESIANVAITAEELERAIEEDNKADGERVKEITQAIESLEAKIDAILARPTNVKD